MTEPNEYSKSRSKEDAFMDSGKENKNQKRQRKELSDEEDDDIICTSKFTSQYQASMKKVKVDAEVPESRRKILELNEYQRQIRKQQNEKIFKNLSEITSQVEADYNAMKENEQRLEQLSATFMKCIRQATAAYKQKMKALHEISLIKKQFEEMESEQKAKTEKVLDEIDMDIKNLRDKFSKESKRKSLDRMRRILHDMQNDD